MKILKRSLTVALLLFVGATVGMLIAQEVSHTETAPIEEDRSVSATEAAESVASQDPAGQAEASQVETAPAASESSSAGDSEILELAAPTEVTEETEPAPACVVDAIYFHNTLRCYTCKRIEEMAKAVAEEEFAEEFASGRMRWSAVNMERQQQYVEEYDLVMPTLILVRSVGEELSGWVALDETWRLIRSESRFSDYVKSEIRDFLEACP